MLRDVDDAALLRKACKGQEAAFSELYARYQRRIHQYAARMCGSAADDVVQETFLAILKADGYDPSKGTVAGYLFGIARHQIIRSLRKQGVSVVDLVDAGAFEVAAMQDTPFELAARGQTVESVRRAIQSLPPVYREVVVLYELQDMDYATVAAVIACPIGTVRSRLHRARALLMIALMSEHPEHCRERHHG